eukprot:m.261650 g.261650  ORF g.261650 m.261650 type:complete len:94 (+) comp15998_c0_seq31:807-1088(+)
MVRRCSSSIAGAKAQNAPMILPETTFVQEDLEEAISVIPGFRWSSTQLEPTRAAMQYWPLSHCWHVMIRSPNSKVDKVGIGSFLVTHHNPHMG